MGTNHEKCCRGKEADILLAESVREDIVEAYKGEEDNSINPAIINESNILILDLSLQTTQIIISQMELFKSINTLIIIGLENKVSVSLAGILEKAKNYSLSELYMIGFQLNLTSVPDNITMFSKLKTLGLYCNQISSLPPKLDKLTELKALHLDYNPIKTILPVANFIKKLEILSINKTEIPTSEVTTLKEILPDCKIQTE